MTTVISVEGVSKRYRLGSIGSGTLRDDAARWWARLHGEADPTLMIDRDGSGSSPDGYVWALRDVAFEVKQGDLLGIIGRNGAGKSTLLKILSRVTGPTSGQARVRGRVASLLEVGTGFHPDLTGRENVFLNGAILGMKRHEIQQRFDEIVAFAEIDRFLDTPVKRYSSGMYVRLAFAVAAHLDPDILIVDEVLAVGDMKFQRKCLDRIKDATGEGRTVLFVSHNMNAISVLCDRGLLLDGGRVLVDSTAEAAIGAYVSGMVERLTALEWSADSAPGNYLARLRAVGVYQEGFDGPTDRVFISKPVTIRIEYECLRDGASLYAALWLRDGMNVDILASSNAHGFNLRRDDWYGKPHPGGRYVSECVIPGNFLNEGLYTVTPIMGQVPSTTIALLENALSFTVVDDGSMREEYTGHWLGCIRPRLEWRTEARGGHTSQTPRG